MQKEETEEGKCRLGQGDTRLGLRSIHKSGNVRGLGGMVESEDKRAEGKNKRKIAFG